MTVILMSPAEGKQPGEEYTGPNEDWLLQNGYAKPTTKRRKEPEFLRKPRDLEYEHEDPSEYEGASVPSQRVLPVDPLTAVQTGHPADPLTDTDEDLRPSQSDIVKHEVTDSTHVVGPLEGTQRPSEDTLQAADALQPVHDDEDGAPADAEGSAEPAPAVAEDELANQAVASNDIERPAYAEPEKVEQEEDPAELEPNETAADADGVSSEEERTLDGLEREHVDAEDVKPSVEEPVESDETN